MSFGSSKTKTSSTTQQDPWGPTVEPLKAYIDKVSGVGNLDITPDQQTAFAALKSNAAEGNPFTPQIASLADWSLGYDNSPQKTIIGDAYSGLQDSLSKYASGDYLDPMSNPQIVAMMQSVGDDVQSRINQMFAGAGRDLSGANQQAVAKGVTAAQLPLLLDQFNKQQGLQVDAARSLFDAGTQTAGQMSDLDKLLQSIRTSGIAVGDKALEAKDYAANQILNLDQQIQQLPYENLALLGSLLLPAAGVGGDSSSKGTSKSSSVGISLSDRRAKDDIEVIGHLFDGQPVYRFTYKHDDLKVCQIGLMAQDVESVSPEAVHEIEGRKFVDYRAATNAAAAMGQTKTEGAL